MKNTTNNTNKAKLKWILTIFSTIAIFVFLITGICFGFLTKNKNAVNSQESKIVLKIKNSNNQNLANTDSVSNNHVFESTREYLTVQKINTESQVDLSNDSLVITTPNVTSDKDNDRLIDSLTTKPYLTFTDKNGTPLFYKNNFVAPNTNKSVTLEKFIKGDARDFSISLKNKPAEWNTGASTGTIALNLTDQGNQSWLDLKNYLPFSYGEKLYVWLNLQEFIKRAKTEYPDQWKQSGENPVNFAFIGNSNKPQEYTEPSSNPKEKPNKITKPPVLKEGDLKSGKYLIFEANSPFWLDSQRFGENKIFIKNQNNVLSDKELAAKINFAYDSFELEKITSYYTSTKSLSIYKLTIIATIILTILSVILMIKNRLLGLVTSGLIGLNILVITALMISFGAIITPLFVTSLLLVTIISFALINATMRKFNREVKKGITVTKSMNKAQKLNFVNSLDITFILFSLGLLVLYLGSYFTTSIAAIVILGSLSSTLLINLIANGLFSLISQMEYFNKKPFLLASTMKTKELSFTVVSKRWHSIVIFGFITIAMLISLFIYGIDFTRSLGLSSELFQHQEWFITSPQLSMDQAKQLQQILITDYKNIEIFNTSINNNSVLLRIIGQDITNNVLMDKLSKVAFINELEFTQLLKNSNGFLIQLGWSILPIFAFSILVFLYLTFRYTWVSGVVFVVKAFLINLILTALLIAFKLPFNSNIISVYFISYALIITNHLLSTGEIHSLVHSDTKLNNYIFTDDEIQGINVIYSRNRFKNLVFICLFTLLMSIPLLAFANTFDINTVLQLLLTGASILLFDSLIGSRLWIWLFKLKNKNKQKRIETYYWNSSKLEEQEFLSINNFNK
ncbi:protein translocase subunit SecDF [Mycoplasma phocoenae]|uniref:Protein-export membrane protein n=1 Tax=Mycoplasma phocoenae TaxID=754517 RepID=A0A858U707_9MOLU|nr:hypothetical protein [Mycoplasma phocoenae]QJG67013.1 hypothetical protein HGG69_01620 [Mycoplasma phocoenae]